MLGFRATVTVAAARSPAQTIHVAPTSRPRRNLASRPSTSGHAFCHWSVPISFSHPLALR